MDIYSHRSITLISSMMWSHDEKFIFLSSPHLQQPLLCTTHWHKLVFSQCMNPVLWLVRILWARFCRKMTEVHCSYWVAPLRRITDSAKLIKTQTKLVKLVKEFVKEDWTIFVHGGDSPETQAALHGCVVQQGQAWWGINPSQSVGR